MIVITMTMTGWPLISVITMNGLVTRSIWKKPSSCMTIFIPDGPKSWAGPNAVIGGLLFGFGIVLAGGCETGWMYRAVEGQVHYWWVGLGNVIGSTILAYYWDDFAPALATDWDKINLLKTFGPMGGLLVTYLLLFTALMLIIGWEKRFFRRAAPQTAKEIA